MTQPVLESFSVNTFYEYQRYTFSLIVQTDSMTMLPRYEIALEFVQAFICKYFRCVHTFRGHAIFILVSVGTPRLSVTAAKSS